MSIIPQFFKIVFSNTQEISKMFSLCTLSEETTGRQALSRWGNKPKKRKAWIQEIGDPTTQEKGKGLPRAQGQTTPEEWTPGLESHQTRLQQGRRLWEERCSMYLIDSLICWPNEERFWWTILGLNFGEAQNFCLFCSHWCASSILKVVGKYLLF